MKTVITSLTAVLLSTCAAMAEDGYGVSALQVVPACKTMLAQRDGWNTNLRVGICIGKTLAMVPTPESVKNYLEMADNEVKWERDTRAQYKQMGFTEQQVNEQFKAMGWQPLFVKSQMACIPNNASPFQLVSIAVQYIEKRPNRWNERYETLVLEAYKEAWPCK